MSLTCGFPRTHGNENLEKAVTERGWGGESILKKWQRCEYVPLRGKFGFSFSGVDSQCDLLVMEGWSFSVPNLLCVLKQNTVSPCTCIFIIVEINDIATGFFVMVIAAFSHTTGHKLHIHAILPCLVSPGLLAP